MARKVFISVLGTGFYKECVYEKDGCLSSATRFIQQATLELLAREWTADDKAYILLTQQSRKTNWHLADNQRVLNGQREKYIGLGDELQTMHLPFAIETLDIPDGRDEQEIWEIFNVIYKELQDGDRLYFDLTHGFRYLPMMVLVMGNYAKFLKKAKIESITYGNFEMAVQTSPMRIAPIIDITSLSELQDWTSAASDYLHHGTAVRLQECSSKVLTPILSMSAGKDQTAKDLRKMAKNLTALTDDIRFCRGMSLYKGKEAVALHQFFQQADGNYLKPFVPLFEHIDKTVCDWQLNHTANLLKAVELCVEFENWQSAVTLLEEGIISVFCIRHGIEIDDAIRRKLITQAIIKKQMADKKDKYKPLSEDEEKKVNVICEDELLSMDFLNTYSNLANVRNDMNHGGMRKNPSPLETDKIKNNILKCMDMVRRFQDKQLTDNSPVFVNLTNHPSSEWEKNQIDAASQYGEVVDFPFPIVDADASAVDLDQQAEEIIGYLLKCYRARSLTVHVMGEMGLTYRLVYGLTNRGVRCLCSTTERKVMELGNGKRIAEYKFVKFRDYE